MDVAAWLRDLELARYEPVFARMSSTQICCRS
jgi:hypothetical protein